MSNKVLCLYHRDCIDGYAAAWVVGHACGFENVEFVPIGYKDTLPEFKGREVYCVDISPDPTWEFLHQVSLAKKVVILDHHETAWEKWKNIRLADPHQYRYEPELSGVGVTWRWFFGALKPMPRVLAHIQDRDLWRFQLPGSHEVHAVATSKAMLRALPQEDSWLGQQVENDWGKFGLDTLPDQIRIQGEAIIAYQKEYLQVLLKRARVIQVQGHMVPVCNIPYDLRSEAGFWLSLKYPFSITYDDNWATGERRYSIRSNKKTGINVLPIAAVYGGGGHRHGAGWSTPVDAEPLFPCLGLQQLTLDLTIE